MVAPKLIPRAAFPIRQLSPLSIAFFVYGRTQQASKTHPTAQPHSNIKAATFPAKFLLFKMQTSDLYLARLQDILTPLQDNRAKRTGLPGATIEATIWWNWRDEYIRRCTLDKYGIS